MQDSQHIAGFLGFALFAVENRAHVTGTLELKEAGVGSQRQGAVEELTSSSPAGLGEMTGPKKAVPLMEISGTPTSVPPTVSSARSREARICSSYWSVKATSTSSAGRLTSSSALTIASR